MEIVFVEIIDIDVSIFDYNILSDNNILIR
jgi:hypothetical protein